MTKEEILDKYAVGVTAGQYTIECDKAEQAMAEYAIWYHDEKTIEAYKNTPVEFFSPHRKAKEIALDAALKLQPITGISASELIQSAETIFQWLITDSIKQDIKP